ncbi:MAG TPA: DUF58 domain-containing protein, partial [Thermoanaerobaculia bacterium]|nr:DUF58 domain-containing protein [Thermoanaerobaculia bacterium]
MRPGKGLAGLLGRMLWIALLAAFIPEFFWAVAILFVGAICAAARELILLRRVRVTIERPDKIALALDEIETITIRVSTSSTRDVRLIVRQVWPRVVEQRSTTVEAICRPGEVVSLDMTVRAIARGSEVVPRVAISMTHFRIMERIIDAGEPAEIHVLPNLKAVRRMHKQLNAFALRGLGARAAPRLGKGREFDRLRDYVMDDDYRDIAWRASARHGRLIVREFRLDRSQDVMLCLDHGHRMAARVAQITRLDHAANAAVLISYITNRMEDKVGILSFDTETDKGLIAGRGAAHLRAITAYVTGLAAEYRHTDYLALATNLRRRLHHRTLLLMLTVLPEREERHELLRAVEMLAPQHLPLIISLGDPNLKAAAQFLPADRVELSRTLVARDIWMARVELMRDLRARGALVVESTPEDAGIDAVNAYID